jgi:hypothetical protein
VKKWFSLILVCLLLAGCTEEATAPTPGLNETFRTPFTVTAPTTTNPLTVTLSSPHSPEDTQALAFSGEITTTNSTRVSPASPFYDWRELPVVPTVSARSISIYEFGLASGNDPKAFSKIGDGNVSTPWFLSVFDQGPDFYDLDPNDELKAVIVQFSGSFKRVGFAAHRGFNTTRLLKPLSPRSDECLHNETPIECELRIHRPCIAIISLGTNQIWEPGLFEREMRQVLDLLVARGVVPILSTKADNLEGDHHINRVIAQLAYEYDVPLWNFWRAVQPLPDHGLQEDNEHLTYASTDFGDVYAMQAAWPVRNLTALLTLDSVWRGLTAERDLP